MPDDDRRSPLDGLEKSLEAFQGRPSRSQGKPPPAATRLIGAIILLGGIGYGVDYWRGNTSHWYLLGGLVLRNHRGVLRARQGRL